MTPPDAGGLAVIVAVQDAGRAKSRLGPGLDAGTRRSLVIAMLDDLLTAVREVHRGRLLVVSADAVYDGVAREHGAEVIRDGGHGYNAAVVLALGRIEGATAALILPGDLPHARPEDVATLIEALATPGVALVASEDGGSAALGLRPPGAIATAFGPDSAAAHREAARIAGVPLREPALDALRVDVDTLDDLAQVWDRVGEATTALLEHLPLPARREQA
ncbi:MAG: 2-phospho-L-lactate guanylyltransferase [Dehalococcoidia bacterium]